MNTHDNNDNRLQELKEIVSEYLDTTDRLKALEAKKKPANQRIKKLMSELQLEKLESDEFTASFSSHERTTMDEVKLVSTLKNLGYDSLVKTVEVPDTHELERLIYDGEFDPSLIQDCIQSKVVQTLSVAHAKNKKKDNKVQKETKASKLFPTLGGTHGESY